MYWREFCCRVEFSIDIETCRDIQGHGAPYSILHSPRWEFLKSTDKHLTLKEWFNGAPPWNLLTYTFPQAVYVFFCVCVCAHMRVLSQYVVQQPALCSQLSSAVLMSLITDPTRRRKGVRREGEREKGPGWSCNLWKVPEGKLWKMHGGKK